jgi:hypothetical protein
MSWFGVVALSAALTGCATEPGMTWMRTDGRPVDAAFQSIVAQCRDAAEHVGAASPKPQRHDLMVAAMEGCMARRGYKWACGHPLANPLDGVCIF